MTMGKIYTIFTILFGLSELYKITLLKVFIMDIFEFKVTENSKKALISGDFGLIYLSPSLNKVILDDSNRPIRIVHIYVVKLNK